MAPSGLADYNEFEEVFNAMNVEKPFGSVRELTFRGLSITSKHHKAAS
jgi:hypothetical protein